jgi:Trk K+ transport system NAD-binding subunit
MKARALFILYSLRLAAPRLMMMVGLTLGGGLIVQSRLGASGTKLDFISACYEVYTQLFFEHVSPLPADAVLRGVFFAVPLLGALILAEGLFKLGGSLVDFRSHREEWMRIMAKTYNDHVILIGLGHVGFRVLEELMARDTPCVVIEVKNEGPFVEEARARGVPVLLGDARRESLLREVGVENAASIVACTDNDLVNLEVCIDARQANPGIRLVMRMFDQSMAQKIGDAFSLDSSFSTSALSAPLFAAAALDEHVLGAYRIGDTMMVSMEVVIPKGSSLSGKSVRDIEAVLEAPVVGIHRTDSAPTHRFARSETLREDDAIICHVPADEISAVHDRV